MPSGPSTILGGLPVFLKVDAGYDSFAGEGYAEVRSIHWLKKDGTPGKEIPDKVRDKAHDYDYGFCDAIERMFESMIVAQDEYDETDEGLPLIGKIRLS